MMAEFEFKKIDLAYLGGLDFSKLSQREKILLKIACSDDDMELESEDWDAQKANKYKRLGIEPTLNFSAFLNWSQQRLMAAYLYNQGVSSEVSQAIQKNAQHIQPDRSLYCLLNCKFLPGLQPTSIPVAKINGSP